MLYRKARHVFFAAMVVGTSLFADGDAAKTLTLAENGRTEYTIVVADDATGVDKYAASELARYLKQITGVEFRIITPAAMDAPPPHVFVGLSAPALRILGKDPLTSLKDQASVERSIDRDIFLYGKGPHGNLYAVMAFLENALGWRWFSVFEYPLLPQKPTLILAPFKREHTLSFQLCSQDIQRSVDYYCQMGADLYFDQKYKNTPQFERPERSFVSAFHEVEHGAGNHHTFFSFIPPAPDGRFAAHFDWQKKKDYFSTNPDYYSLRADGKRAPVQLCFGNQNLRAELTRQILRFIEIEGDDITVSVCAQDSPGLLCHCPACKALMDKHQSPGGPLYDYLIELCGVLREKHPKTQVYTIAYRRSQTQIPPKLPPGEKLPPNLLVNFAPIEDCALADWTHPDPSSQETFRHLKEWVAILKEGNTLALYYGPYGAAVFMPFGDINRLIANMRLMSVAGVQGIHLDQGLHDRAAFSELRGYLFYKLRKDVNADTDAIICEFTDYMYGSAAELIRVYLAELEKGREATVKNGLPAGVTYQVPLEPKNFPYLTPENIHRWQGYFDQMMALTAKDPERCRVNVQLARRSVDLATLWKWFELKEKYPGIYRDHQCVLARLETADSNSALPMKDWERDRSSRAEGLANIGRCWNPLGGATATDLATIIKGGGRAKPLPPELAGVDVRHVKRFVPSNRFEVTPKGYSPVGKSVVLDPDAAFGFAATTYLPEQQPSQKLPFTVWFRPAPKTPVIRRSVKLDEINPGVYRLYKLGTVTITPNAVIGMPEWSSSTILEIGQRLYEPGAENRWDVYVSLKFDGPAYGGSAEKDIVWCDQVVLINKSAD